MIISEFEEKVLEMLKKIDEKIDKVLEKGVVSAAPAPQTTGKVEIVSTPSAKPSAIVEKQEEERKAVEKPPVEGRRVCASCGGTAFRTEEDKTKILSQMGGIKIYAKKNICKKCGAVS